MSYLPALAGDKDNQTSHDFFYWEVNENAGPGQAVLKDGFEGIMLYKKLYSMRNDPGKTNNIAEQHPQTVSELKKLMEEARMEHPEFPLTKRRPHYNN